MSKKALAALALALTIPASAGTPTDLGGAAAKGSGVNTPTKGPRSPRER